jgi:hypothetical protein
MRTSPTSVFRKRDFSVNFSVANLTDLKYEVNANGFAEATLVYGQRIGAVPSAGMRSFWIVAPCS